MDIRDKLTLQEKQRFEKLRVETLVLQNLLKERQQVGTEYFKSVLWRIGLNPMLYNGLEFNVGEDKWELKLNPNSLVAPACSPYDFGRRGMRSQGKNLRRN